MRKSSRYPAPHRRLSSRHSCRNDPAGDYVKAAVFARKCLHLARCAQQTSRKVRARATWLIARRTRARSNSPSGVFSKSLGYRRGRKRLSLRPKARRQMNRREALERRHSHLGALALQTRPYSGGPQGWALQMRRRAGRRMRRWRSPTLRRRQLAVVIFQQSFRCSVDRIAVNDWHFDNTVAGWLRIRRRQPAPYSRWAARKF